MGREPAARPGDLLSGDEGRARPRRERDVRVRGHGAGPGARPAAAAREPRALRGGPRIRRRARHHHRRYQIRVRNDGRRVAPGHRRDADARLVALLAGRQLRSGSRPAQLRQAAAARLTRGPAGSGTLGRGSPAPVASRRGGPGDERTLSRGVPPPHGRGPGDGPVRIAPEGRPFIALGWSLTALAWWAAGRGGWGVGWRVGVAGLSHLAAGL